MDQVTSASRRAFLTLLPAEALREPGEPKRAFVATTCMAHGGVVCRTCGDACETVAIRFRPQLGGVSLPDVDPQLCTGCGECRSVCPQQAISMISVSQEKQ